MRRMLIWTGNDSNDAEYQIGGFMMLYSVWNSYTTLLHNYDRITDIVDWSTLTTPGSCVRLCKYRIHLIVL